MGKNVWERCSCGKLVESVWLTAWSKSWFLFSTLNSMNSWKIDFRISMPRQFCEKVQWLHLLETMKAFHRKSACSVIDKMFNLFPGMCKKQRTARSPFIGLPQPPCNVTLTVSSWRTKVTSVHASAATALHAKRRCRLLNASHCRMPAPLLVALCAFLEVPPIVSARSVH